MYEQAIIDGYNLLYRQPAAGDLASRRQALIRLLEPALGVIAQRITVVFDGATAETDPGATGVEVVFSPAGRTADEVITGMVQTAPRPAQILVVTSDRPERETADGAGAATMSCGIFLQTLAAQQALLSAHLARRAVRNRSACLGDFFPDT
ncbi:MAG: NYN domain-containing protein [Kiritimatiellia bacterium]|nr:NYN domain-containing protein [Lentisphaerota bacterium]